MARVGTPHSLLRVFCVRVSVTHRGQPQGARQGWGCRADLPFFSHDRELFALFAASLLCGAQVSGWGPFISGTDVLHRSRPWGQNRPLHGLRNLARTSRPASHSLTQMPSRCGLLVALSWVPPCHAQQAQPACRPHPTSVRAQSLPVPSYTAVGRAFTKFREPGPRRQCRSAAPPHAADVTSAR